jgi:hypothetical protein
MININVSYYKLLEGGVVAQTGGVRKNWCGGGAGDGRRHRLGGDDLRQAATVGEES